MLKNRFKFYMNLISLPLILSGLLFAIFPDLLSENIFYNVERTHPLLFLIRTFSITMLFLGILSLHAADTPGMYRELLFWYSLLLFYFCVMFGAGPFFFGMKYIALIPALYFFASSAFLMMYASRNLHVRE
jgi:hypothetical protein